MTDLNEIKFAEIGNVENLEELKKIIVYLLKRLDTVKYKTEIIKLCFLLDYKYCKEFGGNKGPTTVGYAKYNYGPYSEKFLDAFEELKNEGKIIEVALPCGLGYSSNNGADIEDERVKIMAEKILSEFGSSSLRQIKDYIYALDEFKKTQFGNLIIFN